MTALVVLHISSLNSALLDPLNCTRNEGLCERRDPVPVRVLEKSRCPCTLSSRGCFSGPWQLCLICCTGNLTLSFSVWQRTAGLSDHPEASSCSSREQVDVLLPLQRGLWGKMPTHGWLSARSVWKGQFFFIPGASSEPLNPRAGDGTASLEKQLYGKTFYFFLESRPFSLLSSKLQATQKAG